MKRAFSATVTTAIAAALLASTASIPAFAHEESMAAISAAVADDRRPEADVARDGLRKPAEIVHFAGVEPGMTIAEIAPGGGYYTRILAESVGPEGKVYALMPAFFANRPGGLDGINALAAQYPNVEVVVADFAALDLPEAVDLVWTTENYHDLANGDIGPINASAFDALKPGGIYFVEDHSAPGTGTSATSTLHRIDPAAVVEQVTAAGFVKEAESDLLHNPDDAHDVNPREVQPTSDKFALRFRKPE
ncbi:class I SAM-dependent methyltransferase [Alteraurantiacibacter aestuarii]|uniref:class I SAM-dependent methyltransferase n=1 Tax=Alteraurantiacibacter aestuarii TaxID=650004 RepID=UPI0031CFC27C